jgi:hypothetical protein
MLSGIDRLISVLEVPGWHISFVILDGIVEYPVGAHESADDRK